MNQAIQDFIAGKRIAVVGCSRQKDKFGSTAARELEKRGYQVFRVHHQAKEIDGASCYPNLHALQGQVDGVFVCLPAARAEPVLREAAELGMRNVWIQQGGESSELIALARELNLNFVSGRCILMYAPPVTSFHGWHRAFARVFGQL